MKFNSPLIVYGMAVYCLASLVYLIIVFGSQSRPLFDSLTRKQKYVLQKTKKKRRNIFILGLILSIGFLYWTTPFSESNIFGGGVGQSDHYESIPPQYLYPVRSAPQSTVPPIQQSHTYSSFLIDVPTNPSSLFIYSFLSYELNSFGSYVGTLPIAKIDPILGSIIIPDALFALCFKTPLFISSIKID